MEKIIKLKNIKNVRDLGGYQTQDGKQTRYGRFVRAASLYRADESDLETLKNYGVNMAVDLRSEKEKADEPNPFEHCADVEYIHVNLFDSKGGALVMDDMTSLHDMGDMYIAMLDYQQAKRLKELFDVFAKNPDKCILFHCSAGKDRTGVTSALLLGLAGCREEDIIENYSTSFENNREINEHLMSMMPDESMRKFLYSKPEYMRKTLDHIHEKYGSIRSYLAGIGMSENQLDRIRNSFVE